MAKLKNVTEDYVNVH